MLRELNRKDTSCAEAGVCSEFVTGCPLKCGRRVPKTSHFGKQLSRSRGAERSRYKSGTLHLGTSQLDENKDEKLVSGVGVEPLAPLKKRKSLISTTRRYTAGARISLATNVVIIAKQYSDEGPFIGLADKVVVVIQIRSKIPALRLVLNSRNPHALFLAPIFALKKKTAWVSGGAITSLARFSVEASVFLAIWCGRWESNPHEEKSPEDFHADCGFRRPEAGA